MTVVTQSVLALADLFPFWDITTSLSLQLPSHKGTCQTLATDAACELLQLAIKMPNWTLELSGPSTDGQKHFISHVHGHTVHISKNHVNQWSLARGAWSEPQAGRALLGQIGTKSLSFTALSVS